MPRSFSQSTAELVMQAVEAVQAKGIADINFVRDFCDLSTSQADNALSLGLDLGLIKIDGTNYKPATPLLKFIGTPDVKRKASILRAVLESYEPFVVFRERLDATNLADTAAQHTKTMLDLEAHREEVKDTLISLGTYTNAFNSLGGGRYESNNKGYSGQIHAIADAANDQASAEAEILKLLGSRASNLDREEVVTPLATALLNANAGQSLEAVRDASRAVESFLARLAARMGVNLTGAAGMSQKLDRFRTGNHLPKKIVGSAKYLSQIRNAADHGVDVDPDVGNIWHIQVSTGLNYVLVACSFISSAIEREFGGNFII